MNLQRTYWIIFVGIVICPFTHADSFRLDNLNLEAGFINQHLSKIQTNVSGDKNSFSHRPFIGTELSLTLDEDEYWRLITELGLVWPGGNDAEYISKKSFFTNAFIAWRPIDHWQYRLGAGLYMTTISGDGGAVNLPNGSGTQNFPIPEGSSTSRNMTTLAAIDFLWKEYSIKAQTYIFNIINSRNRSFSYTLSFHYHFGDHLWK